MEEKIRITAKMAKYTREKTLRTEDKAELQPRVTVEHKASKLYDTNYADFLVQFSGSISQSAYPDEKKESKRFANPFCCLFSLDSELSTTVCCLLSWRRRRNFRLIIFWSSNTNLLPIVVSSHFEWDCGTYMDNMQSPR